MSLKGKFFDTALVGSTIVDHDCFDIIPLFLGQVSPDVAKKVTDKMRVEKGLDPAIVESLRKALHEANKKDASLLDKAKGSWDQL